MTQKYLKLTTKGGTLGFRLRQEIEHEPLDAYV